MDEMATIVLEEQRLILSSLSPGPAQKRLALTIVLGLLVVFVLLTGPLSGARLPRIDSFVPAYATAMFVCDSITAILLYTRFSILGSRGILVIASGYLFTALLLIPFLLVFPGVFVPGRGLLGGPQTTSFVWCLWHAGFPLFVIGYARLKDEESNKRAFSSAAGLQIAQSVALTTTLVIAAAVFFIAGEALLPEVTSDTLHFSSLWPYFIGAPVAVANVSALIVLWKRQRSMLDLWLLVVLCLYLIEVPLSYYPNPVRFSVGWYTVRITGMLASGLVLVVLLYEIETLYARLLAAVLAQRREREARLMTGDAVAASIAHEVRQPLTAMVTSADAGFRFLDRAAPNLERAKEAFKYIAADGHRAGEVIESIRANFRAEESTKSALDVGELIRESLALERNNLEKHRIQVQVEPIETLPEVRGNRVQLQQVLLNLISNAIDAMASKAEPRILCVKSAPHAADSVVVSVLDTGPGINGRDAERIFDPLFTTKSHGMGMGLSICRAIIEAHGGRLWFVPNGPRGAAFNFTLHANKSTTTGT